VRCFEHAIGYLWLFWPNFVLHDGLLLGEGFSQSALTGFLVQSDKNKSDNEIKSAVEAVMNHIHLSSLFTTDNRPTHAQLQWLGKRIQEMWRAKLNLDFPSLDINVEFYLPSDSDDLEEYQVTAFRNRGPG
jgi:hypothetical protein